MRRRVPAMLVLALALALAFAGPAAAQDTESCGDLGLGDADLARQFCDEARAITGGGTRNLFGSGPDEPPGWLKPELLREAYRVDPQKTLDLIDRIRNAGGLPPG